MCLLVPLEQETVTGEATFLVNKGRLCIKGWTAHATLTHPERLLTLPTRDASDKLVPVTWDEALQRVVRAFRDTQMRSGHMLAQYQSGTQTRRVAQLSELVPEPLAEIHPATAKR